MYLLAIGIILFLLGVVFIIENHKARAEGFITGIVPPGRCPNKLVKRDGRIYLYNTRTAEVPGINPIVFNNLEEYAENVAWQHSQGIHCPVLSLEKVYDPQGNEVYKIQPDILDTQGGLPPMTSPTVATTNAQQQTLLTDATRNDPMYNWNSYPGYDPQGQNIGQTTPLDAMNDSGGNGTLTPSPNPMDPNWGGAEFSQKLVDSGYYKGNEVQIAIPP